MENSYNIRNLAKSSRYNFWVGVFVAFCLVTAGIFYYATQKIEYIWRWNRVPIYFAYEDEIEITSEMDGEVESIERKDKEAIITVKGLDGSESYTVPTASIVVEEGEMVMNRYFDVLRKDRLYNFKVAWCKGVDALVAIFTLGILASRFEQKYRARDMARRRR